MNASVLRADGLGGEAPEESRFTNAAYQALTAASDLPPGSLSGCDFPPTGHILKLPSNSSPDDADAIRVQSRLQARWGAVAAEDARPSDK